MKTKVIYWGALLCLIFIVGCSGKKSGRNYEVASAADSTSISTEKATSDKPKLVKTADMRFKVKDAQQTGERISALTISMQGMVMHHSMVSSIDRSTDVPSNTDSLMRVSSYNTTSDMIVRLPSDKMEEFMDQVDHMAVFVNSRNMDIQDKTLDLLSAQLKAAGRGEIIAREKENKIKVKDIDDVLALKDDQVNKQIDNRRIEDGVRYSTIALSFYQNNAVAKELIVNDDPSNYTLPVGRQLVNALISGWFIFAQIIIALANVWVFLLVALAGILVFRHYHKKPKAIVG